MQVAGAVVVVVAADFVHPAASAAVEASPRAPLAAGLQQLAQIVAFSAGVADRLVDFGVAAVLVVVSAFEGAFADPAFAAAAAAVASAPAAAPGYATA
jgi:hypothetical protein